MTTTVGFMSTANHASASGGGIYSDRGILTGAVPGPGGNVFLNTPDDVLFQE
jgi:predicted outer membrane repeat protein